MAFQRRKIIFGRIICIKSSPPCSNDVWTKSFIVGAWEVIWAIWTPARQKMEIGGLGRVLKNTINCFEELLTLNHLSTIRLCPEVRVCGFGSSPRFGSTVDGDWCAAAAEVWHRWGRSVGWEQCGRVGRVL